MLAWVFPENFKGCEFSFQVQDDPGGAAKFFSKEFQCCLPHGTFLLGIRNTSFQYKLHWVTVERFVFFGKLSLKRPFAFLFAPFCLGLWGVAKFLSEFSTSGLPSPRITSRIFRTFFWGSPGQVLLCLKSGHHGRLSRTHGPDVYPGFW